MLIEADLHTHTCASTHAYSTIKENCRYASRYGLKAIAMTDHMIGTQDAPHIWHFENMKCLPRAISGVYVLKGVELNITGSGGGVDMDETLLKKMEWCVASLHHSVVGEMDADAVTSAYLHAAENPYIDVIGHPINPAYPFDMEKCLKAFKEHDKLIEAQRIEQRTNYDLEMIQEMGYCSGIENYSRHLTQRAPGEAPYTLLDYFPEDFMMVIDESHVTPAICL